MELRDLTKTQFRFIIHLGNRFADATSIPTEFSRTELRKHAAHGGWSWAPAWIVKDEDRRSDRGTYSVPELAEYMNLPEDQRTQIASSQDTPDPRKLFDAAPDAPEADSEDQDDPAPAEPASV